MARFMSLFVIFAGLFFEVGDLQAVEVLEVERVEGFSFCQYKDGGFSIKIWQYQDTEIYPYPTDVTSRLYESVEWLQIEFVGTATEGANHEPRSYVLPHPATRGWGWNEFGYSAGRMRIKNGVSAVLATVDHSGVHRFFLICEDGVILLREEETAPFVSGAGLQFFLDVKAGHAVSMSMVFDILGPAAKPAAAVSSASWGSVKNRFSLGGGEDEQLRIMELFK